MPALTNSRFGSSWTSGAEGTTVWPFLSKNVSQRRRISAVSMGTIPCGLGATGHGHATSYAGPHRGGPVGQGGVRAVGGQGAQAPTELAHRWGRAGGRASSGVSERPGSSDPKADAGAAPRRAGPGPSRRRRRAPGSSPGRVPRRAARGVGLDGDLHGLAQLRLPARRRLLTVVTKRRVTGNATGRSRRRPPPPRQQHRPAARRVLPPRPRTAVRTP